MRASARDAAVRGTAGRVLTYGGEPAVTYYFSTSGGHTENVEFSFVGSLSKPWLVGVPDPYDTQSPYHRWTASFSAATLDGALGAPGPLPRREGAHAAASRRAWCAPACSAAPARAWSPARRSAPRSACATPGSPSCASRRARGAAAIRSAARQRPPRPAASCAGASAPAPRGGVLTRRAPQPAAAGAASARIRTFDSGRYALEPRARAASTACAAVAWPAPPFACGEARGRGAGPRARPGHGRPGSCRPHAHARRRHPRARLRGPQAARRPGDRGHDPRRGDRRRADPHPERRGHSAAPLRALGCSPRMRRFTATQGTLTATAEVRTPSCARRLELLGPAPRPRRRARGGRRARPLAPRRPARPLLRARARAPAQRCRRARLPAGRKRRQLRFRDPRPGLYRLSVRTPSQLLRRTVRANPPGGRLQHPRHRRLDDPDHRLLPRAAPRRPARARAQRRPHLHRPLEVLAARLAGPRPPPGRPPARRGGDVHRRQRRLPDGRGRLLRRGLDRRVRPPRAAHDARPMRAAAGPACSGCSCPPRAAASSARSSPP